MYKIGYTQRKRRFLFVNGSSFYKKRDTVKHQVWRCKENQKGCSAVVFTAKDISESGSSHDFVFKNEHNHSPQTNMRTRVISRNNIVKKALETNDPPRQIIAHALQGKSIAEINFTGTHSSLAQSINRARKFKNQGEFIDPVYSHIIKTKRLYG